METKKRVLRDTVLEARNNTARVVGMLNEQVSMDHIRKFIDANILDLLDTASGILVDDLPEFQIDELDWFKLFRILLAGRKIQTIKKHRSLTGSGLLESKNIIDSMHRILHEHEDFDSIKQFVYEVEDQLRLQKIEDT